MSGKVYFITSFNYIKLKRRYIVPVVRQMERFLTFGTAPILIKCITYCIIKNMGNETINKPQRLFEWDDEKEQRNIKMHKISFETAKLVFNDENRLELFDINHSAAEDRIIVIGKVDKVLFVVYTERGDKTRIISARAATKAERKLYGNSYIGFIR